VVPAHGLAHAPIGDAESERAGCAAAGGQAADARPVRAAGERAGERTSSGRSASGRSAGEPAARGSAAGTGLQVVSAAHGVAVDHDAALGDDCATIVRPSFAFDRRGAAIFASHAVARPAVLDGTRSAHDVCSATTGPYVAVNDAGHTADSNTANDRHGAALDRSGVTRHARRFQCIRPARSIDAGRVDA